MVVDGVEGTGGLMMFPALKMVAHRQGLKYLYTQTSIRISIKFLESDYTVCPGEKQVKKKRRHFCSQLGWFGKRLK